MLLCVATPQSALVGASTPPSRVAVVGGGLAGLATAFHLLNASAQACPLRTMATGTITMPELGDGRGRAARAVARVWEASGQWMSWKVLPDRRPPTTHTDTRPSRVHTHQNRTEPSASVPGYPSPLSNQAGSFQPRVAPHA